MTELLNWTDVTQALPKWLSGKEPACQYAGDVDSIPGLRRSPGGGNGNSFQYSCLEPGRGAWQAIVHRVGKNHMGLSEPTHARSHTIPIPITPVNDLKYFVLLVYMIPRVITLSVRLWSCIGPFSFPTGCFYFSTFSHPHWCNYFQLKLHLPLCPFGGVGGK